MRARYAIFIGILIVLFILFEFAVISNQIAPDSWIEKAIQGAGVFVALIAAVIALHSSDPKVRRAEALIELIDGPRDPRKHNQENTRELEWKNLGHYITQFHSVKVYFRLVNTSKITLHKPTLSFRLPLRRHHPHRAEDGSWSLNFNSNLFNSQDELQILQFTDTQIISNSNVPFWNDGDELIFWIRMAIDAPDAKPFNVYIALNAENVVGKTYSLEIDPMRYLPIPA